MPDLKRQLKKRFFLQPSLLGDSAKHAVYFYLKRTFKIKKQEIPDKVEGFTTAIEEIFGPGAKLLKIKIMKHLYEKVGGDFECFPEKDELLFNKYVAAVGVLYIKHRLSVRI